MSGGHIQGYHILQSIADELEALHAESNVFGPAVQHGYGIAYTFARMAFAAIKCVDYLESGEFGRDGFLQMWDNTVNPVTTPIGFLGEILPSGWSWHHNPAGIRTPSGRIIELDLERMDFSWSNPQGPIVRSTMLVPPESYGERNRARVLVDMAIKEGGR
jgi:hypothetical protein